MSAITDNRNQIVANRGDIIELDGSIGNNKSRINVTRSTIGENAALIAKNYNAAFLGNHQLTNENTERLFQNRIISAQSLPAANEIERNYRDASINKTKLAYLDHKSLVNTSILSISEDMAALNAQAIAINKRIMEVNENIKNFNSSLIEEEAHEVARPVVLDSGNNASLIAQNTTKIHTLQDRVHENNKKIDHLIVATDVNRKAVLKNSEEIDNRRVQILKNQNLISGIYERWSAAKRELNFDVY